MEDFLRKIGLDKYDRNARLAPALLVLLPLLLFILVWWPSVRTLAGGLASLATACGVTFFLARVTEARGVRLETGWGELIGRPHSARLLSHADTRLSPARKRSVHDFMSRHGHPIPSRVEEQQDDADAQDSRIVALEWLSEITRPTAARSLLLDENITYGFWRNMFALKPAAVVLLVVVLAADAALLYWTGQADSRFPLGVLLGLLYIAAVLSWLFLLRRQRVLDASLAFAKRLFAQVDNPAVVQCAAASAAAASKPGPAAPEAGTPTA